MKEYKYILLDLDGTITDPMIGITRCVEYALNHFSIQVNDLRELCPFIGPPLLDSFRDFYHFTDEQAKEATEKYRERFADTGIFAKRILDYFDIARYFTFVAGSGLDGSFYTKGDVIRHVLESNNLTDHPSVVMIGDRKHDIIGAKENRLDSIGVLYGYGDREELSQAGADYIVEDIAGLRNLLFHQ